MQTDKSTPEELIHCDICLKEVPESASTNSEADDYVHHFCGLECAEIWRKQQQEVEKENSEQV